MREVDYFTGRDLELIAIALQAVIARESVLDPGVTATRCPCPGHGAHLCMGHGCPCPLHMGGTCDGTRTGPSDEAMSLREEYEHALDAVAILQDEGAR